MEVEFYILCIDASLILLVEYLVVFSKYFHVNSMVYLYKHLEFNMKYSRVTVYGLSV